MTISTLALNSAGIPYGVHRDHPYQQAVRGIEELQRSRKKFRVKVIISKKNKKKKKKKKKKTTTTTTKMTKKNSKREQNNSKRASKRSQSTSMWSFQKWNCLNSTDQSRSGWVSETFLEMQFTETHHCQKLTSLPIWRQAWQGKQQKLLLVCHSQVQTTTVRGGFWKNNSGTSRGY